MASDHSSTRQATPAEILEVVFGNYRAEWMNKRVYSLYREPSYFPTLTTEKPVILEGGRGTGKTTTLLAMSYEGRFALEGSNSKSVRTWEYFACYIRMDSNRVGNFKNGSLGEDFWQPIFAHYLNLLMVNSLLDLAAWFTHTTGEDPGFRTEDLEIVALSLGLTAQDNLYNLRREVLKLLVSFEATVQSRISGQGSLSLQGAPVTYLAEAFQRSSQFSGKKLFFLIDEFENLREYQQAVVNTLIKHSGLHFSLKVGMRPYGWKYKKTITGEYLQKPMDYDVIEIGKRTKDLDLFAQGIIDMRLRAIKQEGIAILTSVNDLLPSLSQEDEFRLQGGSMLVSELRGQLDAAGAPTSQYSDYELYVVANFPEPTDIESLAQSLAVPAAKKKVVDKVNNYGYSALFTIMRGRPGMIRKYYCGWSVLLALADGNLRFLLWLVHRCLENHLDDPARIGERIGFREQTQACERVGEEVLKELPDESQQAGRLVHLVLGIGRVFQVLAGGPGHAPESTQFARSIVQSVDARVTSLLTEGVRHLALVELSATKMQPNSVKDSDFCLHPIFAPFFCYSYRRKRKLVINDLDILSMAEKPGHANVLLHRLKADVSAEMPGQSSLYASLFK